MLRGAILKRITRARVPLAVWYLERGMRSTTTYRFAAVGGHPRGILLNAWVAMHALETLFSAERWLAHTLQVLRAADETQIQYSIASSNARGYLLNVDPNFLTRYAEAAKALREDVGHVQELLSGQPHAAGASGRAPLADRR